MNIIKRDTTRDLFLAALNLVNENGHYDKAAEIMDYVLPEGSIDNKYKDDIELSNYRFDFDAIAQFGGSEGIYIDCYLSGEYTETELKRYNSGKGIVETETRRNIGTFKTLNCDLESFKIMGELCGALIFYASQYVNKNIDRYTPTRELERKEKRNQVGSNDPCEICTMKNDCSNNHTDVKQMCEAYTEFEGGRTSIPSD